MNKKFDILVVGAALFAMFFGAGSLIFPPYLGMTSGPLWFLGFVSFFVSDIGIAFLGIVAMVLQGGDIAKVTGRIGHLPSIAINTAMVLCIGPLFATPRTGATTYEMAIVPIFGEVNMLVFSIIYFAIAYALTIRPTKVVDIVGKVLTPLLLIILATLIIIGIVNPIAPISEIPMQDGVVANGIIAGYQALDVFASLVFAMIIIQAVKNRGYENDTQGQIKVVAGACVFAGICLCAVYGGITYLGATVSTLYDVGVNQGQLIVDIATMLMGKAGSTLFGIVVGLACLTTAIGLTSASGEYFSEISKGKIKYEYTVTVLTIFSILVCNMGLTAIISFSLPILSFLYPMVLVLIITSIANKAIKNDNTIKGAVLGSAIISLLTSLTSFGISLPFIESMPLYAEGMNWIIPAIICGFIGSFVKKKEA